MSDELALQIQNDSLAPSREDADEAPINPAVARCCKAVDDEYQAVLAKTGDKMRAKYDSRNAYRTAMPPLSGAQNIRDFVACVAHGMLLGLFTDSEASRLLYAAQVAVHALPKPRYRGTKQAASTT